MGVNDKKISVIVPVYNMEEYLHRCIESICRQTLEEIEVILVDDGSTDGSGKICDEYAAGDRRVQVIHKANGGLVSARQAGVGAANGRYVGFVDSDDWIEADMYLELYALAAHHDADIVMEGMIGDIEGDCRIGLNQLPAGKYAVEAERKFLLDNMICCQNFFQMGILPYLWNKLFRREIVSAYISRVPRSIRVGEDAAAVYPMLAQAEVIVVSDAAHYHYCQRAASMMLEDRQEAQEYENALRLHSYLKGMFAEVGMYERVEEQLGRYAVNSLLTRAYGKFAGAGFESVLFPFADISCGDSLIIYGAGAFGKAVYQYAVSCEGLKVRAWIDRMAGAYRRLGLDVRLLEDVDIEDSDKIVVAVFSEPAYRKIAERLLEKGAAPGQIRWIDTEELLQLKF